MRDATRSVEGSENAASVPSRHDARVQRLARRALAPGSCYAPPAERPSVWDLGLIGVAAYKVSRLVVTDQVTEPLRAPFTEGGKPTGRGMRRALGQLVSCPHCVAPWAVLGFGTGLVWAPRPTRYASGLFASMVVADVMHRGYSLLQSEQKELSAHAAITAARAQSIEGGAQP